GAGEVLHVGARSDDAPGPTAIGRLLESSLAHHDHVLVVLAKVWPKPGAHGAAQRSPGGALVAAHEDSLLVEPVSRAVPKHHDAPRWREVGDPLPGNAAVGRAVDAFAPRGHERIKIENAEALEALLELLPGGARVGREEPHLPALVADAEHAASPGVGP